MKEKPAEQPPPSFVPSTSGVVQEGFKIHLTTEEATVVLSLIKSGWSSAVIGSREGYELLASVEDKLVAAGAAAPQPRAGS